MKNQSKEFGVLTLATPNDYLKAIGLALSIRISNPGIKIAVACSNKVRPLVEPYFDIVVEEQAGLKGFIHKVYLDIYSPFENTVFLDSDVLVFKPLQPYVDAWVNQPYNAVGIYETDGIGSFGFDRKFVMQKLGKSKMVEIGGAGHAIFYKPQSTPIFEMAREVSHNYSNYAGNAKYADEDALNIVMTSMDIPPRNNLEYRFFTRHLSARTGTLEMDASKGICNMIYKVTGEAWQPCMMHFANNEAPVVYTIQLIRLFRKFNVPILGLVKLGIEDFIQIYIKYRLSRLAKILGI